MTEWQPGPGPQWNVPPPPHGAGPQQKMRGSRIAAGIGTALLGHLLTVGVQLVAGLVDGSDTAVFTGLIVLAIAQVLLLVACLSVGIVLTVRKEPGFGVGLLIGWGVGLLIAPVVGFGVCVMTFNEYGSS